MIVHKRTQVFIAVEMTEDQSSDLLSALRKVTKSATTGGTKETFSKEEAEVISDLRQSLLNS